MCSVNIQWKHLCTEGQAFMDISMDIHDKSMDMGIDVKYRIHGNPGDYNALIVHAM
jgi:hypothetical protein